MANLEHLEILKQGVKVWNRWREENPEILPDLSKRDLTGLKFKNANLSLTNLIYTRLKRAQLQRADFQAALLFGAKLQSARLRRADFAGSAFRHGSLKSADLTGAILADADFLGTDFTSANLTNCAFGNTNLGRAVFRDATLRAASLHKANLTGSYLTGADLQGALFGYTSLGNVDLSEVKGLRYIKHISPSSVGVDTLAITAAGLSVNPTHSFEIEVFFRNAGVPEATMDLFRLMVENPIVFYSCFISYSHADQSFARRLHDHIQARGIRSWLDEHDLKPGDRILDVVNDAIRLHDKILLCCSEASLRSWWVKDEIRKAIERERRDGRDIIIPLMVDRYLLDVWEDGMAADLRSRLAADFTGWEHNNAKFEEQSERVVKALRTDEGAA